MKASILSGLWVVLVFALALAFSSSLEPFSLGLISLAWVPALVIGAFAGRSPRGSGVIGILIIGAGAYAAWVALRSPVADFGRSDGLLLGCGLAACCWAGWLSGRDSHRLVGGGLMMLALANVVVAVMQWRDPAFTPIYAGRETDTYPSGFYGHYNHFANFLLGVGFLLGGLAALPGSRAWVRLGWAFGALTCVIGIVLSQSRGAFLALAVGVVVLILCWVLDLMKRGVKWFGVALISLAVVLPMAGFGAWRVARVALASRGVDANGARMIEDSGRLDFASMAVELALEHPLTGGGSRSFSYEVFKKWDPTELWVGGGDVDMVHNELLQAATDYGWIGLALVVLVIFGVVARGMTVVAVGPALKSTQAGDSGITAGALAGIAAMLTQAMFSFVFHMAPDVILLGLLFGILAGEPWPLSKEAGLERDPMLRPGPWIGAMLAVLLALVGWRDAVAWWLVARPGAAGLGGNDRLRYDTLQSAFEIRPDFRIEQLLVRKGSELALLDSDPAASRWPEVLMAHHRGILARNPWDYAARLGLARQLDVAGNLMEAEEHYRHLLPALDNREMFYHARFAYGSHAYRRAYALWQARKPNEAMAWAQEAKIQMERSRKNAVFDGARTEEYERVVAFIRWLDEARVTAEPGVVPELR
jgi:hypothetical protein